MTILVVKILNSGPTTWLQSNQVPGTTGSTNEIKERGTMSTEGFHKVSS